MGELSIEEKAKAYDEAIERARKINSGEGVAAPPDWTTCEVIFPELKESEDERVRKHLVKHFQNKTKEDWNGMPVKDILAWLEKQGSQKLTNSAKTCKDEQNPTWSEEDEKNIEKLGGFLTEVFCYGHVYVSQKDKEELQSWLKSLKERYTWKPSDEQMRALEDAKMRMSLDGYGLCPILQTLINDLKNLKG